MDKAAKRWRAMKVVLLVAGSALMQGCIGGGVFWTHTVTYPNPDLEHLRDGEPHGHRATSTNYTSAWLQTHWVKPTSVRHIGKEGTAEVWTYNEDLNCNGVMLCVLIPIPLEVPVGYEWTKVVIQDGRVISATVRSTRATGGVLGYTLSAGPCNIGFSDFGFHSMSDSQ